MSWGLDQSRVIASLIYPIASKMYASHIGNNKFFLFVCKTRITSNFTYSDSIVIEINFQLYESKSVTLKTTVRIVIAVL